MGGSDIIQDYLDRVEREQKTRDAALLTAFNNLANAMERSNLTLNLIHEEATKASRDAAWCRELMTALPDAIGAAINNALDAREDAAWQDEPDEADAAQ